MGRFRKKQFGFVTMLFLLSLYFMILPEPSYAATTGSYSLNILHTNDSHSHVEMYPKLTTAVKEQRSLQPNSLLVDAGDVFDGTTYFTKYKGQASLWFMNNLSYAAMTFGNHEFNNTANVLADFVKGMTFPMISSNVNVTKNTVLGPLYKNEISSSPLGGSIYPAIIKTINGQKVAIFGLLVTTSTTGVPTSIPNIVLEDYTAKAKATVAALKQQGINKIIVLSHLGYDVDRKIASSVNGIDVIIGGHTHTVLTKPVVIQKTEPTVIVQTGAYLNYLGVLNVTFNSNGVVTGQNGKLLDLKTYVADPAAQQKLNEFNDITAPAKPVVNGVTDKDTAVTGTAEAGSKVEVKVNGSVIGTGITGADGRFTIPIPVQKAGNKLSVTAADLALNVSAITTVVVQAGVIQDTTAPAQPVVNGVTDKDTAVTGTAEPGSKVEVKVNGAVIGTGTAGTDSRFIITIPVQTGGTTLSVTAADIAGNVSAVTTAVVQAGVVQDTTAPSMPAVNEVSNLMTEVTGTAEAGATVTVTIGTNKYTAAADSTGTFKVTIPKQTAGTQLTVIATDAANNVSAAKIVTVVDKKPPSVPKVKPVTDLSTAVTGSTTVNAKVTVTIGTKKYTAIADYSKGTFKVTIPRQRAGTKLAVTAEDAVGNVSAAKIVTVLAH